MNEVSQYPSDTQSLENQKNRSVWLVEDDASIRFVLEKSLAQANFSVHSFPDAETAVAAFADQPAPAVVFTDVRMPGMDGLALTVLLKARYPNTPVIVMSALADLTSTVAAFDAGAFDFLAKPFDIDVAITLAERGQALHFEQLERKESETPELSDHLDALVGKTSLMQAIFRTIGKLSRGSLSVLITGETGTGKELIARALHQHSPRSKAAFVALNTAAIAPDLLESELFGHEVGAFTGAHKRHIGRFEQAQGGTLFLDEIGDMPMALQAKLLRVLAEGEFYPLGSRELKRCDVRILTATHRDLDAQVAAQLFRADLLHRLNVVQLPLPALRERIADLPLLVERFLLDAAREIDGQPKRISALALQHLMQHAWPGNVRELRNLCFRLTVLAPGDRIELADLAPLHAASSTAHANDESQPHALEDWLAPLRHATRSLLASEQSDCFEKLYAQFETCVLSTGLAYCNNERQLAAQRLGVGRNSFSRKLKD